MCYQTIEAALGDISTKAWVPAAMGSVAFKVPLVEDSIMTEGFVLGIRVHSRERETCYCFELLHL